MSNSASEAALISFIANSQIAQAIVRAKTARLNQREVSAEAAAKTGGTDYVTARNLLKGLGTAGAGRFVVGRSGYKTRLEWSPTVNFAYILSESEKPEAPQLFEEDDAPVPAFEPSATRGIDVVTHVKGLLARFYNTDPDKVRITVEV